MATMHTITCRHCSGEDIAGYDYVPGLALIQGFVIDANGKPDPIWAGETEMLWDNQHPVHSNAPYICRSCNRFLSTDDLVIGNATGKASST